MFGRGLSIASTVAALLLLIGFVSAPGHACATEDPAVFVEELGGRFLKVLTSPLPQPDRERQFHRLIDQGFDVPAISRQVLGQYWETTTEAQRAEFSELFTSYMVQTFARSFGGYGTLQLTAVSLQSNGPTGSVIGSRINGAAALPSTRVEWRVACTAQGNRVVDIVVDGISLMTTQQQQLTSVIRRSNGKVEALLRLLRLKTRRG